MTINTETVENYKKAMKVPYKDLTLDDALAVVRMMIERSLDELHSFEGVGNFGSDYDIAQDRYDEVLALAAAIRIARKATA